MMPNEKRAELPPTRGVNRNRGKDSANGGSGDWLSHMVFIREI
jgi:hypothetical protein